MYIYFTLKGAKKGYSFFFVVVFFSPFQNRKPKFLEKGFVFSGGFYLYYYFFFSVAPFSGQRYVNV